MVRIIPVLTFIMLSASYSFVGSRFSVEQSNYKVLAVLSKDFEIRRYGSRLALETTIIGGDRKRAKRQGFRRLFNFINGANELSGKTPITKREGTAAGVSPSGTKIAMTAPVKMMAATGYTLM